MLTIFAKGSILDVWQINTPLNVTSILKIFGRICPKLALKTVRRKTFCWSSNSCIQAYYYYYYYHYYYLFIYLFIYLLIYS